MNKRDIELLIEWNFWATKKILDKVAKVSEAAFLAPQPVGFSAGSLRGTLVHAMSAEWAWRMRLQHGVSPSAFLSEREFPNLSALILRWATEEDRLREFVAGLSDADFEREVAYKNMAGAARTHTIGHALTHLVIHGQQHRVECAAMLTSMEQSPGDIDFIYYLIEKNIA
jgi:uncharacterized damage-inducible protein DinB